MQGQSKVLKAAVELLGKSAAHYSEDMDAGQCEANPNDEQ